MSHAERRTGGKRAAHSAPAGRAKSRPLFLLVLAALALKEIGAIDSQAKAKKNIKMAIEHVASRLGNTATICRKCYVHPDVLTSYLNGKLVLEVKAAESELRGALSALSGQLSISWELEHDTLVLKWEESGGPLVHEPKSRGFGTRSLMASVEKQLGGEALFDWRPEGLVCRLRVPLARKSPLPKHGPAVPDRLLQRAS